MQLGLTDDLFSAEQLELGTAVSKLLDQGASLSTARDALDESVYRSRFAKTLNDKNSANLVQQGYLQGFLPEQLGGLELGVQEFALFANWCGRTLLALPFVERVTGGAFLLRVLADTVAKTTSEDLGSFSIGIIDDGVSKALLHNLDLPGFMLGFSKAPGVRLF